MRINRFPRFGMSWNPFLRGSLFYGTYFGIMGMFFPFLNVYLQQELKFSGRQIGGKLYDRFGPKTVFLCGSLCVGGAALILLTAIKRGILTDVSTARIDTPVT